jgi:hypothetical protein
VAVVYNIVNWSFKQKYRLCYILWRIVVNRQVFWNVMLCWPCMSLHFEGV